MRVFDGIPLALVLCATAAAAQEPTRTNAVGMEFVLIEPGSMVVGRFQPACPSPPPRDVPGGGPRRAREDARTRWTSEDYRRCERMARADATPGFTVRIPRPYYIGRYEVTQAEWERVMGTNPSVFRGSRVAGDAGRHPVDNVTWEDAQAFVRKLNAIDTTARYRLPTEFEWEYAARAGADDDLTWAEIREQAQIMLVDKGTTRPVGGKAPNAWGLYDTLGNVWEWVEDHYNGKLFPDPTPPVSGTERVLRGGSFLSDVKNATYFTHAAGPGSGFDVGFRVVLEVP
jgi:formylglycine-generating enzyme required for sulfatase activity